jgi:hypothetical protein
VIKEITNKFKAELRAWSDPFNILY